MNCLKRSTGRLFATEKDGWTTKIAEYLSQMRNIKEDGNHFGNGIKKSEMLGEENIAWKLGKVEFRKSPKIRE